MNDVSALIERLRVVPQGTPIEQSGATAVFAAICGCAVDAFMQSRGPRRLTQREEQLLQSMGATTGHERCGTLYAGNVPAAATTAVLLCHLNDAAGRRPADLLAAINSEAVDGRQLSPQVLSGRLRELERGEYVRHEDLSVMPLHRLYYLEPPGQALISDLLRITAPSR